MAKLPTNKRNDLPSSAFALPSQRKYPINDAAHVRNAAARLEQERAAGKISPSDYAKAKSRIVAAGKRFGVKSDQSSGSAKAKRIRVSADLGHGGSLSVRHMADRTISLDGVAVTLSDDGDDKPVWIQLAKPGTFRGHSAGPFELNAQTFDEIVRNFNGSQNHEIPIDFEHASEADATDGTIPTLGAPAQGWIREMKIENGNLWGLVYWGDRAREYIRAGQYKYFSPAIRFGSKDRVSGQPIGARMTSGALTNNPFLDGMKPLAAKDAAPDSEAGSFVLLRSGGTFAHAPHEYMPAIKTALKLPELCSARECADQLGRLRDQFDLCGGLGLTADGVDLSDYMLPLRSMLGSALGSTWEQVFDIVEDLIDAAIDRHELEFHSDDAVPDSGDASMTDDSGGGASMRDQAHNDQQPGSEPAHNSTETTQMDKTIELTTALAETKLALKDAEAKSTATEAKLKDAEAKVQAADVTIAELTLSLKDAKAAADQAAADLAEKDATIKTLTDAAQKREEADLQARVDLAFDTYKDARKLSEDDKEAMLIVLKSKPETFERQYPKVAPSQQHLQRNLTDNREAVSPKVVTEDGSPSLQMDLRTAARKLSAEKGISLADAQAFLLRNMPSKRRA